MKRFTHCVITVAAIAGGTGAWSQSGQLADPRGNALEEQTRHTREDVLNPLDETLNQPRRPIDSQGAAQTLQPGKESGEAGPADSNILSKLPSFDNLNRLKAKIEAEPNNLDHYFAYAQMASKLGKYKLAADTFEQMLALSPTLHRVRLDLGSAYLRLGEFEKAKEQLTRVLETEPPPSVRANIENVLAKVVDELREHDFSGLITVGMNWDDNANSAPQSGEIVIQDNLVPLTGEQLAQRDLQFFTALGANHTYRPRWAQDERYGRSWRSSANYYRAKQSTQEALNLEVFSVRSGPEFTDNQRGIRLNPALSYTHIVLSGQTYLRTTAAEARLDIPVSDQWLFSAEGKYEHRNFENSSTVSTFEDREGSALQARMSARYMATDQDIFNASLSHRRERTREEYFDNEQIQSTIGYTRILPDNMFLSSSFGHKVSLFDDNDPLISSKTRRDQETSLGATLGYRLDEQTTATVGYQYRRIDSNIHNYDYDNHRLSASIGRQF